MDSDPLDDAVDEVLGARTRLQEQKGLNAFGKPQNLPPLESIDSSEEQQEEGDSHD